MDRTLIGYLGSLRRRLRGVRREANIKKTAPVVTGREIVDDLRNMGVVEGDIIFLHSSLKSVGYVEGGPRALLNALVEAVSPEGTVIVPTYYLPGGTIYETCQIPDYVFDPQRHGTGLGRLPEEFLKLANVSRSIHPTHSVSAIGKHARYITGAHHLAPSIFGAGSPWDRFLELRGKVLGLGVTMGPITFYHLLEDRVLDRFPLPVRMDKSYMLKCRVPGGNIIEVPITPLNPLFQERRIDAPGRDDLREYFWTEFERAGLLHIGRVGQARCWTIEAQQFIEHLTKLMAEGITIYSTAEELAHRPLR